MQGEMIHLLEEIKQYVQEIINIMQQKQSMMGELCSNVSSLPGFIDVMSESIPSALYNRYKEFFDRLKQFCSQCENAEVLTLNQEVLLSSLELFVECLEELEETYRSREKKCACCNKDVVYEPLPEYYDNMKEALGVTYDFRGETLNREEYLCPVCGASDRDRMIVSYLKK